MIAEKYLSDHRKHRYELANEPKNNPNRIFIDKELEVKVIKECRTTAARKFRIRLGLKQFNVILTKEKLVLKK